MRGPWTMLITGVLLLCAAFVMAATAKLDTPIRLTDTSRMVCAPYAVRAASGPDQLAWSCKTAGDVAAWILYQKAEQ